MTFNEWLGISRYTKRIILIGSPLKRFHLFEFCDQKWVRGVLREAYMDCLNGVHRVGRPYQKMHRHFAACAQGAKADTVLDLASGGGEQLAILLKNAEREDITLPKIIACDLFPDVDQYKRLQSLFGVHKIDFIESPVSVEHAAEVAKQRGIRLYSICSAMHHFPPALAKRIIANAATYGDGIIILELSMRHAILTYLSFIPAFPLLMILPPFISKRFTLTKFLLTTIIPIAPFMVWFDGIVSSLRTYTAKELRDFFPEALQDQFVFEFIEHSYFVFSKSSCFYAYRKP